MSTSPNGVCFRIADLRIRVRSAADGPRLAVQGPALGFLTDAEESADVELEAAWGDLSGDRHGKVIFDSNGAWRLFAAGESLEFRSYSSNAGPVPYAALSMQRGYRKGKLLFHRSHVGENRSVDALQYPLDEVLMVHLLGTGLGAELHACGVVDPGGKGILFCAHSEGGKTTMARFWERVPKAVVLSDDRIVVRKEHGEFFMYGTPWHGEAELAVNRRVPLDAVFLLERGVSNAVRSVDAAEGAAELFARSFVPFHDAVSVAWTLGFLGEVAANGRCARLPFVPDENVCRFVSESVVAKAA